jgi:large subunit ribosomal protein L9
MSKLILTNEVSGLGSAGDVVEVKDGYARNYLIPQGFAVRYTRGAEKQVEQIKAARAAREHASIEEAEALKAALEAAPVKLSVKAGKDGRLFGAVKAAAIADAVAAAGHAGVDKRKLEIPTAIKSVGAHKAQLKLRDGLVATITVQVVAAK